MKAMMISLAAILIVGCGSDRCVTFCNMARTCSGVTGWKTSDCNQTCKNYETVNTGGNCTDHFNAWLDCEDQYKAQLCTQEDPCETQSAYSLWQACVATYCTGAMLAACNF